MSLNNEVIATFAVAMDFRYKGKKIGGLVFGQFNEEGLETRFLVNTEDGFTKEFIQEMTQDIQLVIGRVAKIEIEKTPEGYGKPKFIRWADEVPFSDCGWVEL